MFSISMKHNSLHLVLLRWSHHHLNLILLWTPAAITPHKHTPHTHTHISVHCITVLAFLYAFYLNWVVCCQPSSSTQSSLWCFWPKSVCVTDVCDECPAVSHVQVPLWSTHTSTSEPLHHIMEWGQTGLQSGDEKENEKRVWWYGI